jgi:cytochrome c
MPVGDPVRGQSVFNQCRACHAADPGRNGIGPSLAGVVGREAGGVAGYSYSPANKNSHLNWDRATLFAYLAAPSALVPGTKMSFVLRDAQQRADVIAYLETLR